MKGVVLALIFLIIAILYVQELVRIFQAYLGTLLLSFFIAKALTNFKEELLGDALYDFGIVDKRHTRKTLRRAGFYGAVIDLVSPQSKTHVRPSFYQS
jgi:predicted tellurium resistance membrane protein TerC